MRNKYNREFLESIIIKSYSWANVCREIGIKPSTGSQTSLKKKCIKLNLDFSHFTGCGYRKGKKFKKKNALEYCFKGSIINSDRLKKKLIRDGYKNNKCEICGIYKWIGEELSLELDHIDSDHYNNEFSNLQILCPNCHSIVTKLRRFKKKAS